MLSQEIPRRERQNVILVHQPGRKRAFPRTRLSKHQHPQHLSIANLDIRTGCRCTSALESAWQSLVRRRGPSEPSLPLRAADLALKVAASAVGCGAQGGEDDGGHAEGEEEDEEGGREQGQCT